MKKNQNPFKIVLDDSIPIMLGRSKILNRLKQQLTKTNPINISVVGPKRFGKSVILYQLAQDIAIEKNDYLTVCYWDLRHGTPRSDQEFKQKFAERLKNALKEVHSPLADYLEMEDEGLFDFLILLHDELKSKNKRILTILDGFDHVMVGVNITRNLLDNLLDLLRRPGQNLRLVTGSRRRLRELCRTEESRSSDFWELFKTFVEVGHMVDADLEGFLAPFTERKIEFQSSARKELLNWTGGIPILLAGLLENLFDEIEDGASIPGEKINNLSQELFNSFRDILEELWDDCSIEIRSVLEELSKRDLSINEVSDKQKRELEKRGLVRISSDLIKSSCRFMSELAKEKSSGMENMRRLFGAEERFDQNIRSLLEIQLGQIEKLNPDLKRYVKYAIRDMLPEPKYAITWIRNLVDKAITLVWEKELPPDKTLPVEWIRDWQDSGRNRNRRKEYYEEGSKLPSSKGDQLNILRLITGSDKSAKTAKYISKSTYLLIDHLVGVGNFGQHQLETHSTVSMGFAASVCFAAVELCKNLTKELKTTNIAMDGK